MTGSDPDDGQLPRGARLLLEKFAALLPSAPDDAVDHVLELLHEEWERRHPGRRWQEVEGVSERWTWRTAIVTKVQKRVRQEWGWDVSAADVAAVYAGRQPAPEHAEAIADALREYGLVR